MTETERPLGRRIRNASIPAVVFGLSLVAAGAGIWYWRKSVDDAAQGQALFQRMCLLGLSIALAAFLCRMIAGARSVRLGLVKPEPGDFGALGWFVVLLSWGILHAKQNDAPGASFSTQLLESLRVGLIESPLYVVFGLALAATIVFCLLDLGLRRALARR